MNILRSFNKWDELLELAIETLFIAAPFFKKINRDGSFRVPEDFQHDLFINFSYRRISTFPPHALSFRLSVQIVNQSLAYL